MCSAPGSGCYQGAGVVATLVAECQAFRLLQEHLQVVQQLWFGGGWHHLKCRIVRVAADCRSVATPVAGPGSVVDVQQRVGSTLWRLPAGGGKCSRVTELVLLSSVSCCCLPANSITDVSHPSATVWPKPPPAAPPAPPNALLEQLLHLEANWRGCENFLCSILPAVT